MKKSLNFLLIDDDTDDHEIFNMALKKVDSSVVIDYAHDGVDALKKLNELLPIPHIIFLDLNMPRMNGKQFLMAIRENERFDKIPIYIYSTSLLPEVIDEAKKLGADGFIQKPADFRSLIIILKDLLVAFRNRA